MSGSQSQREATAATRLGLAVPNRSARQVGFTLLEVMVALAIVGLGLSVLAQSQTASVRAVGRAKQVTIATTLARQELMEVEDRLFEEGFSDFEETDKGDFREQGFEHFRYELQVDPVELPTDVNSQSIADSILGGGSGGQGEGGQAAGDSPGLGTGAASAGAQMMSSYFSIFRSVLEQSIRRVTVRVLWKEGDRERDVSVATYFTDPRVVDSVMGDIGSLLQLGNAAAGGGQDGDSAAQPGSSGQGPGSVSVPGGDGSP